MLFLIAAAFSIQMALPHADVQQDSRGMGQAAQASDGGICWGETRFAPAVERPVFLQTEWAAATNH